MTFKIGDMAQLKSGGPALTVVKASATSCTCMWYADEAEEFRTIELPVACIDPIEFDDEEEDEDNV